MQFEEKLNETRQSL